MTINLGASCAQLNMHLVEVTTQLYAIAPELKDDRWRKDVMTQVQMFGNDLFDPTSEQARNVAHSAYLAVWGPGECPRAWWKTALGQTVAHVVGYPRRAVPYMAAAAILGVSRQYIYQLQEKGVLETLEGQSAVTADSLRDYIQSRP